MCLAIIYHDRTDPYPLRVMETRDENIRRLSGARAAQAISGDINKIESFCHHWKQISALEPLFSVHDNRQTLIDAQIVGGLDKHGGTWVALSQTNKIYSKLLIGTFANGTFGENSTPELQRQREAAGYAKRGGLCLDAVSFRSAAETAEKMPHLLAKRLKKTGELLLPNYIVVMDINDAFILTMDDTGEQTVIEIPQQELTMLSIRGINAPDSVVTSKFLEPLRKAELPQPFVPNGWDSWVKMASIQAQFNHDWAVENAFAYNHPNWRSHKYSIIQPPYFNTDDERFHRAATAQNSQADDVIEWTSSSTCVAADRDNNFIFLYNERALEKNQPLINHLQQGNFPACTKDYHRVELK